MAEALPMSDFQRRVLAIPECYDVFLGGGRGGAKSHTFALIALRHAEQYQDRARILYLRQSYKGLADFESMCRDLFGLIYGPRIRYNGAEHIFRFPDGGYLELGQLEGAADYGKYQGHSYTLLEVDEGAQYADPAIIDKLRSNLRGPKDMPIRQMMAANPGDVGHAWIAKRYVFKAAPWHPFFEEKSKREWIYAPSTYLDNPFIDQAEYRSQLESSCPSDPELLRAWLTGDWSVARGAFFASVLDESRNAADPWPAIPTYYGVPWETFLAHDFGSSAPSCTYLVAKSPGAKGPDDRWYPRDSLVLVDELATNEPGHLNKGMGYTVPVLAELIREMSSHWKMKSATGVADDACFSSSGHQAGSIAKEFQREKVFFRPAKKGDRLTGWNVMRRLLQDAGKRDVPGLYISRHCEYFWQTVPYLGRDPKRVEDLDSRGPDHGADAIRYGCLRRESSCSVQPLPF
ncbi:MAG TPA: phage terminase large subunit [Casimicrobiaceae bacterium]|nr:phage terminase large subunit [Casimicrobiaceae bacterium]